ncbi:MAG: diadenylate cyclase CdaA [Bacteroidales bacterium]|nr:diadenylate cyclase CdaA [Bacteroidales bacterium]
MLSAFIHIRLLDIFDIFLVAVLFYQLYMLIRGTVAYSITLGIAAIYIFWWAVRAMQMELLSTILGSVLGVGVIALIIVFQQEIRRFLIFIGSRYMDGNRISVEKILNLRFESKPQVKIRSIMKAVMQFSLEKTGALIVIGRKSNLDMYAETGDVLNAETSSRLFVSIFNKTSPLHDGAVIVEDDKVKAARVILPVTDKMDLPPEYGLRHRAGLGISEVTDSLVIIVSEETGQISMAENGILQKNIPARILRQKLEEDLD